MIIQSKEERKKEVEFQLAMLDNLKRWIRNLIILSSFGVVFAYWSFQHTATVPFMILRGVSIVIIILSAILCVVVGLAYKRGKENVDKILHFTT